MINRSFYLIILLALFYSCSPQVLKVNGYVQSDPEFYLLDSLVNKVCLNKTTWNLDSVSNGELLSKKGSCLTLKVDERLSFRKSVQLNFSKDSKTKVLSLGHGRQKFPVIRYYPNTDTISFDNLRFFTLSAVNDVRSPEIVYFFVDSVLFSYGKVSQWFSGRTFTNPQLNSILNERPEFLTLDSVIVKSGKDRYVVPASRKVSLRYYNGNVFDCMDKHEVYAFKDLVKLNTSKIISLSPEESVCPILFFSNLGSISRVQITNTSGEVIYSKSILAGELSINNYFLMQIGGEYSINITCDYEWQGKLIYK